MALVVGVLLGEDGEEEVALDEVGRNSLLAEESLSRHLIQFLLADVGIVSSQEEGARILVLRQIKAEVPAVGGLSLESGNCGTWQLYTVVVKLHQFALHRHLAPQRAVPLSHLLQFIDGGARCLRHKLWLLDEDGITH